VTDKGAGSTYGHHSALTVKDPDSWQLGRVAQTVAEVFERRGWPRSEAREVLGMLGIDDDASLTMARVGLRAGRRQRLAMATAPKPPPPKPRPVAVAPVPPSPEPEPVSYPPETPMCGKGLHAMLGKNLITRPDRNTRQCHACRQIRRRAGAARALGKDTRVLP